MLLYELFDLSKTPRIAWKDDNISHLNFSNLIQRESIATFNVNNEQFNVNFINYDILDPSKDSEETASNLALSYIYLNGAVVSFTSTAARADPFAKTNLHQDTILKFTTIIKAIREYIQKNSDIKIIQFLVDLENDANQTRGRLYFKMARYLIPKLIPSATFDVKKINNKMAAFNIRL